MFICIILRQLAAKDEFDVERKKPWQLGVVRAGKSVFVQVGGLTA